MTDRSPPTRAPDRSAVRVAVATPLRAATEAGEAAAAAGGNALDAALTAAAMLTVAYPHTCALGGDLLALVREPDGSTTFINGSGRAALATDVAATRQGRSLMPLSGPLTVTVPGLVSGWAALHAKGAVRSWGQALEPAIDAASEGISVSRGLASSLAEDWSALVDNPGLREVFAPTGQPLTAGRTLRQPALARTLRSLASGGAEALYRGVVGEELVAGLQRLGVPLTMTDLAEHAATEQDPLELNVDGWTVYAAPPNSQGFVLLRLLGMLEHTARREGGALHERVPADVLAAAFHETAAERDRILADPAAMTDDVPTLLSESAFRSLLERAQGMSTTASATAARHPHGDTAAVVSADSEGRSVSLIQSVYDSFGAQLLEPTTGIIVHNRGACFSLDPDSPNVLAPGKRPAHTLLPALAERRDERLVVGTMGGEFQPQILLQVLSRLLSGATPAQSVAAPRWTIGSWERDQPSTTLNRESDTDPGLLPLFRDWPGPLIELPSGSSQVGHAQAIRVCGDELTSGTDPRADGHTIEP